MKKFIHKQTSLRLQFFSYLIRKEYNFFIHKTVRFTGIPEGQHSFAPIL